MPPRTAPTTPRDLTPTEALQELREQHDDLRELIDSCEYLADEVDRGDCTSWHLTREMIRLGKAFDAHNTFEEQLLRPLLRGTDAFAEARLARLVRDHVAEHRTIRDQLGSRQTAQLREVIDTLRAHLDAEERYMLTDHVLSADGRVVDDC